MRTILNHNRGKAMTDLTEQWKKGELPSGWYYTKLWKGCNIIDKFIGNQFLRYDDSDIVEVIAPVPSYEEWQRVLHYAGKYECEYTSCVMDYENLKEENQQLKELLKECKANFMYRKQLLEKLEELENPTKDIVSRINTIIGESGEQ